MDLVHAGFIGHAFYRYISSMEVSLRRVVLKSWSPYEQDHLKFARFLSCHWVREAFFKSLWRTWVSVKLHVVFESDQEASKRTGKAGARIYAHCWP